MASMLIASRCKRNYRPIGFKFITCMNERGSKANGFSIPICTFNGQKFLRDQLSSIENQTVLPSEVIAFDDGSTDDTMSILHEFMQRVSFSMRVVQNERTFGFTQNLIQAVKQCSGNWIVLCDQDDVWHPRKLETMRDIFDASPEVNAIFTDGVIIDDQGNDTGERLSQRLAFDHPRVQRDIRNDPLVILCRRNICTGATLGLRADIRDLIFPLPTTLPPDLIQDGWIALVAAATGGLRFLSEPLTYYRAHSAQQIGVGDKRAKPSRLNRILGYIGRRRARLIFNAHRSMAIASALKERLGSSSGTE